MSNATDRALEPLQTELTQNWGGTEEQVGAILKKFRSENSKLFGDLNDYIESEGITLPDYDPYAGDSDDDWREDDRDAYQKAVRDAERKWRAAQKAAVEEYLGELQAVPESGRLDFLSENYGDVVKVWSGSNTELPTPINEATIAADKQPSTVEETQQAVNEQVLGTPSTSEGLYGSEDNVYLSEDGDVFFLQDDGRVVDKDGNVEFDTDTFSLEEKNLTPLEEGSFVDGEGNVFYETEDGTIVDEDGNVRREEGTGLAAEIESSGEQATLAEQELYGEGGLVDQIGQVATDYGTFAEETRDALDAPENDFASQITSEINDFIYGANEGEEMGFLDYQADLLGAGEDYKTQMTSLMHQYDEAYDENVDDVNRLRGEYASMTQGYESELNPLRNDLGDVRDRLGEVSEGQMGVARDAADRSYYNRLRDTLYADATDNIGRQTEAGMDSLRQNFAASGADPTSPAFIAAMKDLQQGRSDAMVSSRRKAILDSYGLGGQMLSQRSQALSGAGNAIATEGNAISAEMGALDSLYGMRAQGLQADANLTGQLMSQRMNKLNTRGDMIGNIYNIDRTNATTGIEGLNTVLGARTNAINTSIPTSASRTTSTARN